jgi:hypothetical protein
MPDAIFSKTVKAGKITYFFDVREAKNQSKYLTITASQLQAQYQPLRQCGREVSGCLARGGEEAEIMYY